MLMDLSVMDIQNYIIKPFKNGGLESVVDYVKKKVLISNMTLR